MHSCVESLDENTFAVPLVSADRAEDVTQRANRRLTGNPESFGQRDLRVRGSPEWNRQICIQGNEQHTEDLRAASLGLPVEMEGFGWVVGRSARLAVDARPNDCRNETVPVS